MMKEFGKEVKREYCHEINDDELKQQVHDACYAAAYKQAAAEDTDKHHREEMFSQICEQFKESYDAAAKAEAMGISEDEVYAMIDRYYHDVEKEAMRRVVLDEHKRLDGRKTTEIRPIWCEVSPLPGPHGSAIFTRGETQSLSTVTLGTKRDEKQIDEALIQGYEKFLLHYNFPPFSTARSVTATWLAAHSRPWCPPTSPTLSALSAISSSPMVPVLWLPFAPDVWH